MGKCNKIAVLHESDLEFLKGYECSGNESVMIYLSSGINQEVAIEKILNYMNIEEYHCKQSVIDTAYYLRRLYIPE